MAGVANWVWEAGLGRPETRRGVLLYAGVLSTVLIWGGARLALAAPVERAVSSPGAITAVSSQGPALFPPSSGTVRVATLNGFDYVYAGDPWTPADRQRLDDLFAASLREARAGARIIVWAEALAFTQESEQADLITRAAAFARAQGVYLLITPYLAPAGRLHENKSILLDPSGQVAWEYWKSNANQIEGTRGGDGRVALADSPYGRLAGAICWDLDFPAFVRQAGREGADMMLVPSSDWRQIDPLHTRMAAVRAVENGMAVVRATRSGLSAAFDHQGRPLAYMDHFLTTEDRAMVAQVPVQGRAPSTRGLVTSLPGWPWWRWPG